MSPPHPAQPVQPRHAAVKASLLVVVVALSFQTGSAVAVHVIQSVGVIEAVWLRTAIAALLLVAVRPRSLRLPGRRDVLSIVALSLALLAMNASFYAAISRAPIGIVVAIEFLGPLGVAVAGTRRALDFLWIACAAAGVVLLAGPTSSVSSVGLTFALAAAASWAAFLVLAKRAVTALPALQVTTLMLIGSALLLTPALLAGGVHVAGHLEAIGWSALVAVLSSAFPYFVELVALSLVRASTYGVLLSIEPAMGALTGFVILSQRLSLAEIAAIVAVMVAAAGASWSSGRAAPSVHVVVEDAADPEEKGAAGARRPDG